MVVKTKLYILIFLCFSIWLFSCKNTTNQAITSDSDTTKVKLEEITAHIDTSIGSPDVFLKIISDSTINNTHVYIGKGLYKGKIVGLKFEVKNEMSEGISKSGIVNKAGFAPVGIKIISIGKESDEFIKALAELYQLPTTKPFSKSPISATTFSLNQKDADLDKKDHYTFKLFFEENSEDLECELFFDIDLAEGIIELDEKDSDYRENIIKEFTK